MLDVDNVVMVVIDVQGKLAQSMYQKEKLFENTKKLIRGMQVLEVPVILTEQNPEGLGMTIPEIKELLPDTEPISKLSFSCLREKSFLGTLEKAGRRQVLLAGIEAHICVYQTAVDLKNRGYEVQVVVDAISSRAKENKEIAREKLRGAGIELTSVETALFELLRVAEGEKFKQILKIVK